MTPILPGLLGTPLSADAVLASAALAGLLLLPFRRPSALVEGAAGLAAAALVLASRGVTLTEAGHQLDLVLPVVAFLVASLLVAECCAAAGVFRYLGSVLQRGGRGDPQRLLVLTVVLAAVVTAVLSLDATVVMLTPVALAADSRRAVRRPLALVCSRLANSASLLLPVSNLTNLLAVHRVPLHLVPWAAVMALPWLVVVLVEYAAVRLRFADGLAGGADPEVSRHSSDPDVGRPTAALVLVGLMLLGFAVSSPLGVDPAWVAAAAAAALVVPARRSGELPPARLLSAAQPAFAVYVLGLVVVVAAVDHTFLGRFLRRLLDAAPLRHLDGGGLGALGGLLLLTLLTTALTSVLNNLPAVLLLVPLVAPLGTVAVLAVVVGVDVGAGLVYTGSLANLLWTRVLHGRGLEPSARAYHLHAALVTPVALTAAVVVLWAENGLGWVP